MKPEKLNNLLRWVKVPSEFSRRTRDLEKGYKAEELRNIGLLFFPLIFDTQVDPLSQKVWAHFSYLMRLYYTTNEEFLNTTCSYRQDVAVKFINLYLKAFGKGAATYMMHLMLHLETIRKAGPFQKISAIPFESNFAVLRRSFCLGTLSIPKQILSSMYIRMNRVHACTKHLKLTTKSTIKTDDRYLYSFDQTSKCYSFCKIKQKYDDNTVDATEAEINAQ